jgi:hypothetical protein
MFQYYILREEGGVNIFGHIFDFFFKSKEAVRQPLTTYLYNNSDPFFVQGLLQSNNRVVFFDRDYVFVHYMTLVVEN